MAYAELADLKGRAGRLSPAWDANSNPSDADLLLFLEAASGDVDAALTVAGAGLPLDDEVALRAARTLTTDVALVYAIEATWPAGSSAPAAVEGILEGARSRAFAGDGGVNVGTVLAVVAVSSPDSGGATDLWTEEGLAGNESLAGERLPIGRSMRL